MAVHVFDAAMALRPDGADRFVGHCGRSYWNSVGPFGGISAATMLNAVLQHPALLGEPVSLTVNFASGLTEGPFAISARAARTNRSTQHWMVELQQAGAQGAPRDSAHRDRADRRAPVHLERQRCAHARGAGACHLATG
jgi:acyl-coenzyme A thioesterase PaaI-like protein